MSEMLNFGDAIFDLESCGDDRVKLSVFVDGEVVATHSFTKAQFGWLEDRAYAEGRWGDQVTVKQPWFRSSSLLKRT